MSNVIQRAALAVAKLAGYNAALPNKTQALATRIGTNPNGSYSQQQRLRLSLEGENAVKNTPFGLLDKTAEPLARLLLEPRASGILC